MTREPNAHAHVEGAAEMAAERWADQRLQEFFRAEIPSPWPHSKVSTAASAGLAGGWSRSHLALAASLLVLIFSIGLLSQGFRGNAASSGGNAGEDAAEKLDADGLPARPKPAPTTRSDAKPLSLEMPMSGYEFSD